jgi:hypothetical protein
MHLTQAWHLMAFLLNSKINISRSASVAPDINLAYNYQVASTLPYGTNIYGLGEVIASSGFRHDIGTNGGVSTIQTHWSLGVSDPIDQNL